MEKRPVSVVKCFYGEEIFSVEHSVEYIDVKGAPELKLRTISFIFVVIV